MDLAGRYYKVTIPSIFSSFGSIFSSESLMFGTNVWSLSPWGQTFELFFVARQDMKLTMR